MSKKAAVVCLARVGILVITYKQLVGKKNVLKKKITVDRIAVFLSVFFDHKSLLRYRSGYPRYTGSMAGGQP
jgi:hypothetical protein